MIGYEPAVSVCTKKVNGELEISVADNGNGIPEKVLEKVFQPFFATSQPDKQPVWVYHYPMISLKPIKEKSV